MGRTVDVIFDFGSPNAYFAMAVLPAIAARTGAAINVIPCLLGGIFKATNNQPPMLAFGGVKGKLDYDMLEIKRFVEKHKLARYRFNPHFPVNTLLIMRGYIAALELGVGDKYRDVVVRAMWEDGEKMDDPEVVARVLNAAGLPAEKIIALTKDEAIKKKLAENTQAAVDRGAFGIPTFYVGKEMFFGKDRLAQVEEELAKA
ncbi:MAG: 2-hydroxychromene-2-carboxylate isomerase [Alphaproteobacteria bacterium]|nr:2-hydroxychromene-2-carboxylate isomerase [Alphaproteobacteria bacterium]